MARDGSGNYALPQPPFTIGTVADQNAVNDDLADLAVGVTNSLSRDGQGGMRADLAMGSHKITGMLDGTAATDGSTTAQVNAVSATAAAADAVLAAATTAEAATRAAADTAETNARTSADSTLAAAITAESTLRATADTGLTSAKLARDGSQAMAGGFNMGLNPLYSATSIQFGPVVASPEAVLHGRTAALGTTLSSVQTVFSLGTATANNDRLLGQYIRTGAGAGWDSADFLLQRTVDSTYIGGLAFRPHSVDVQLGGIKMVIAQDDGVLRLNAASGQVLNGNSSFAGNYGATSYPGYGATNGGVGAVLQLANGSSGDNVGSVLAVQRAGAYPTGALVQFYVSNSALYAGQIAWSGSATLYQTVSDHRLKQDIRPIEGALDMVAALPAVSFEMIQNPGARVHGFIAHEVQAVVPEVVSGTKDQVGEDGKPAYQAIDKAGLVPILWAAVAELAARLEALEALRVRPDGR